MTPHELRVDLSDLLFSMARAVDLISPAVASHHLQVAYLCLRLAEELEWSERDRRNIVMAGALHDIGAFSAAERVELLAFEENQPDRHAVAGALLLDTFTPIAHIASLIRHHHTPWNDGHGDTHLGEPVPMGSHLIHLADRVAVLIDRKFPVLAQVDSIVGRISAYSGSIFVPDFVRALGELANRDYVWLEVTSDEIERFLTEETRSATERLGPDDLLAFARLLCRVIDFKSAFTATHSSGVAAVAVALGRGAGFSQQELLQLETAAFLHDLGKLAIPSEILEKAGRLTLYEHYVMREHVYRTYEILERVPVLHPIMRWGALHQERLDGSGYPFGYTGPDLPLGARIMAVADVFTALAEDRPYRDGMNLTDTRDRITEMGAQNELDARVVGLLVEDIADINRCRAEAQQAAEREFQRFHVVLDRTMLKPEPSGGEVYAS